jgi:hypothetical protein
VAGVPKHVAGVSQEARHVDGEARGGPEGRYPGLTLPGSRSIHLYRRRLL